MTTQLSGRRDAFDELFDFRQSFDNIFNRLAGFPRTGEQRGVTSVNVIPPIESWIDRNAKQFHLRVALPGVDPNNVQLNVEGNVLTLSGEQRETQEKSESDYYQCEIAYGRFERSVPLPEGTDTGKISAEYRDGMLEVTAPITAAALPRRVEIKTQAKGRSAGA